MSGKKCLSVCTAGTLGVPNKGTLAAAGYHMATSIFQNPTKEASVVRRIFAMYCAGKSLHAIAVALTHDRIVPKRATGPCKWRESSLHAILRNDTYVTGIMFGISGATATIGQCRLGTAASGLRSRYCLFYRRRCLRLPDGRVSAMLALYDAIGNTTTCLSGACFGVAGVVLACLGMRLPIESRVIGVQVSSLTTLVSPFVEGASVLTI